MNIPYIEEYLKYMKNIKNSSEFTLKNYPIHLRDFFQFTEGEYEVNLSKINEYKHHLIEVRKFARASINAKLMALRSYYHFLYDEEIIDTEIAVKIKGVVEEENEPKKLMSQDKIHSILDKIEDVRDRAMLETLYATGVRESELSDLNIDNIDFVNELIYVIKGKRKKSRVIPISKTALKWLRAYIGARKTGPLFLNNRGNRLGPRSVYNVCKTYFPFPPHDLRHSFATHMIVKTGNIKAVSEMLGHSSVQMTEQIYTHMNSEDLKNIYKTGGMDR